MSKSAELRTKRAKAWESAKEFLDSHRKDDILSSEDNATYERMEKEITDLSREIERQENLDKMEREMAFPTSTPIMTKPSAGMDRKTGRASDEYRKAFWNQIRSRGGLMLPEISNALQIGTDSEGGYLVPDEFERTLIQALADENVIRSRAHVFTTSAGERKIPVVSSRGEASWLDEEATYPASDDVFGQQKIGAHKLGTRILVSEELLNDNVFDLENYISNEFARRIGDKEEDAFLNGNGTAKPTGILNSTGGADVGITAAGTSALTADEILDLYYSLKGPYRKRAIWILNDSTVKAIRKLKDGNGQYLWQPGLNAGEVDTLLGKQIFTSPFMPTIVASAKTLLLGDLSYYWIGDRQGITFKRLNELYAETGQIGFLASKRLDGKLILPEAIKVLQMHA